MQSGFLLAVDYGMESAELLAPHRSAGTLACFSNHRRDTNPLESPGEKDITAHVDFTALARCAVDAGFKLNGYTDQHHFIIGAAGKILSELDGKAADPAAQKKLRAIRMLMHPETMGVSFKAISLTKNLPRPAQLTGFRHARDPNFPVKK
jgi:SAM-dependent MidA family methyltransferase